MCRIAGLATTIIACFLNVGFTQGFGETQNVRQLKLKKPSKSDKSSKSGKSSKTHESASKSSKKSSKSKSVQCSKKEPEIDGHWPDLLFSRFAIFDLRPTDTDMAVELGWVKSSAKCNPSLGEEWTLGGERGLNTSVAMYFTPSVGDEPGRLSGIEADFYGYIEENLVGTYFSEERESADGTYHSVAVTFHNSDCVDLCDYEAPFEPTGEKYLAVQPDMANTEVPTHWDEFDDPTVASQWMEGSCIPMMGYHRIMDTKFGADHSYKAENLMPIVAMYDKESGSNEISAFFFVASSKKQIWDQDPNVCPPLIPTPTDPDELAKQGACLAKTNLWDPFDLYEPNQLPLFWCVNYCGECEYSGSPDGVYTTMHWHFKDPMSLACKSEFPNTYCDSGEYPTLVTP